MTNLTKAIENLDPEDLAVLTTILDARQELIQNCSSPEQARELYRQGEALESKLRLARAKFAAQRADLYQTGFLLKALAADLPAHSTLSNVVVRA